MARQLWMLRHGEAEPHGTRPDDDRRLTDRGVAQSAAAGAALAALGIGFDAIFTSPKVRAHVTATTAAEPLETDVIVHAPLASGFDADEARALLAAADDGGHVLVVGHEPDFSRVVHELTGGDVDFKKGGVAAVRLESLTGRGELITLLRPRELGAIAAAGAAAPAAPAD
ncbi:phosphohistidine phosphatase SixA [Paraconexibacter antarcticus]|uniref:Phosphohistidine phosphatase SixA n=1 Tax=Paraconexibacter antarcticus TaxID=2949664 RepID=A0ABY5DSF5_9ACTN|nr:phosphohistidine phosphatase SixA [Paraconexibacter antarcticus]UTI64168.1 phosphohistidine phosphatase SixA [Paraconexibacter antarcticus]